MLDTVLQRFGCLRIVHVHVPMHACRPMTILNEFISTRRQPQHRDALAQKSILWMLRSIPPRTTLFQTEVTSNKNEIKYMFISISQSITLIKGGVASAGLANTRTACPHTREESAESASTRVLARKVSLGHSCPALKISIL